MMKAKTKTGIAAARPILRESNKVLWITVTALFMAINIIFATMGIPVPGGAIYLCDVAICTAAMLLDPLGAFAVGGIGSFLGDMFFYPSAMFVTLVVHGLQAVVISLLVHSYKSGKPRFRRSLSALLLGGVIMVVGYTLGKAYVYGNCTLWFAIVSAPYDILQTTVGIILALLLCYRGRLFEAFQRITTRDRA